MMARTYQELVIGMVMARGYTKNSVSEVASHTASCVCIVL